MPQIDIVFVTITHEIYSKKKKKKVLPNEKFLPSLGLQGHQADLVVPANKNKTGKMKKLTSFK